MIKTNSIKFIGILVMVCLSFLVTSSIYAVTADGGPSTQTPSANTPKTPSQTPDLSKYENINSTSFKLLICDGPPELVHYDPQKKKFNSTYTNPDFIPCDFRGLMLQAQHLINIAFIAAVLVTIIGLMRTGYLYISGVPANINKAKDILKSVLLGFAVALCAWFVVYQLLIWLTDSKSYTALLGI